MGMFWNRKKTVDDIIVDSFSEPGRWKSASDTEYVDTVTKATLVIDKQNRVWINGVHQPHKVQEAFFRERLTPYREAELAKKIALEELYGK